ncbi:hypothetical protein [Nostoc sp.]
MAVLIWDLCAVMRSLKTPGKSYHKLDVLYLSIRTKRCLRRAIWRR